MTKRFKSAKKYIMSKYGFSAKDTEKIFTIVDSIGACSYADVANIIFESYFDNPEKFLEDFGFPMFQKVSEGIYTLSDAELLADIYIQANMVENGGDLVYTDKDGKNKLNENVLKEGNTPGTTELKDGDYQNYMSYTKTGISDTLVNKYLDSKSTSLEFKKGRVINIKAVKKLLDKGEKNLSLGAYCREGNPVPVYLEIDASTDLLTGEKHVLSGAHATTIVGYTEAGLIVSSWGGKYLVPFDVLNMDKENGNCYISLSEITDLSGLGDDEDENREN